MRRWISHNDKAYSFKFNDVSIVVFKDHEENKWSFVSSVKDTYTFLIDDRLYDDAKSAMKSAEAALFKDERGLVVIATEDIECFGFTVKKGSLGVIEHVIEDYVFPFDVRFDCDVDSLFVCTRGNVEVLSDD